MFEDEFIEYCESLTKPGTGMSQRSRRFFTGIVVGFRDDEWAIDKEEVDGIRLEGYEIGELLRDSKERQT
jgi:hypothetical protein